MKRSKILCAGLIIIGGVAPPLDSPMTLWFISARLMPPLRRFPSSATRVIITSDNLALLWRERKPFELPASNHNRDLRKKKLPCEPPAPPPAPCGGLAWPLVAAAGLCSALHLANKRLLANDATVCWWNQLLPPTYRSGRKQPLGQKEGPRQARGQRVRGLIHFGRRREA